MRTKVGIALLLAILLSIFVTSQYTSLKSIMTDYTYAARERTPFSMRTILKSDVLGWGKTHLESTSFRSGRETEDDFSESLTAEDYQKIVDVKIRNLQDLKKRRQLNKEAKKKEVAEKLKKKKELVKKILAELENAPLDVADKDALAESVKRYRRTSIYPPNLIPLGKNQKDPLARPEGKNGTFWQPLPIPNSNGPAEGESPLMGAYAISGSRTQNYYTIAEEEVEFALSVTEKNGRVPASIKAEVFNQKKEFVTAVAFNESREEGLGYSYNGQLILPELSPENLVGNYFVKVEATVLPDNDTRVKKRPSLYFFDSFALQYRQAKFKNKITERLTEDGDLEFEAKYQIYQKGDYIFQATLYDMNGHPVAFVENPLSLEAGRFMLPITFHGILFYDGRLNGPFILKHLALKYVRPNLSTVNAGIDYPNHQTQEYNWEDFNAMPCDDKAMMSKLNSIESFLREFQ
ncbi:MAG: hypothetical protein A2504_08840 [Bdellovibrionales bacterium RIFOXYD12_FULL_39_22]|nr:MAG: hypothetical protein A2385_13355 [Bdellovibrionales bacterium RIFOXYB1_FULL_39_21]OFZ40923.1 MAG: hypothetical protein A2485_16390 [Bdellovibrionales bacterium RIFOXYC12_FULL_39_17]OFZ44733.1 MAG: hypothetical protein A2404_10730 [Bdellovibrionales bacterium RIFOXYC1_FULL_39_130]OFZ69677.1 MAG: hypothetical protein A2451_12535 [Bdellovibrionales bacterium RIFOXYC2_FULL_39_8]OFZ74184.1 MAG: hypothetical protein A2560_03395 [Bdellovibrionales bacterium RIFOXYD1_FULL_39_84]OFZ92064.1 MAG: